MDISIVIPLLNESESLVPLHKWIHKSLEKGKRDYEIIFIDDGSSDDSASVQPDALLLKQKVRLRISA